MTPVPAGFDLTDPAVQQSPHDSYAALRGDGVQYVPANDAYVVSRYEDALAVLRDPDTFSSRLGSNREKPPEEVREEIASITARGLPRPRTLLDNDPPDHTRFRRLVARAFTPRKMVELRPFVAEVADELIDAWPDPSSVELVGQFSSLLPVRVIAHALNIPSDRQEDFRRWTDANTASIGGHISARAHVELAEINLELQEFFVEQYELRRVQPQDDLLTTLLNSHVGAEDDGSDTRPLDMAELVRITQQLLVAGSETTSKLIAEMMRLIAETDGEWERIQAEPDRIPGIVEESLRIASPNQGMSRIVTRDTSVAGVEIPEGARVIVLFASANRDDAHFGCPSEFQPDRANAVEHVSFGHGVHYCVGASLSRLEAVVALERLSARVESYRLTDDNTFEYLPSVTLRGLRQLQIDATLTPG